MFGLEIDNTDSEQFTSDLLAATEWRGVTTLSQTQSIFALVLTANSLRGQRTTCLRQILFLKWRVYDYSAVWHPILT